MSAAGVISIGEWITWDDKAGDVIMQHHPPAKVMGVHYSPKTRVTMVHLLFADNAAHGNQIHSGEWLMHRQVRRCTPEEVRRIETNMFLEAL